MLTEASIWLDALDHSRIFELSSREAIELGTEACLLNDLKR
jgi:hypothetical protein